MEYITYATAHEDLLLGLYWSNHKGAANQPKDLRSLVEKDAHHGFPLPIKLTTAKKLSGAEDQIPIVEG